MTRVAYLVSQYPAPSHTFVRREIAALRKRGIVVLPFSVRPGSATDKENVPAILAAGWYRCIRRALAILLGQPIRSASTFRIAQRHRPAGARGWLWAQFHFVEALALAAMLREARVDRLHSHFANSGATVGMLAAHHLRLPWSLTLHGISETDPPAGSLLPEKIERADFVACASWFMRAQAMRVSPPETWPKLHIVRCGVEAVSAPPSRMDQASCRVRFVTVGRVSAEKGYPGLIEALADVVTDGLNAHLTIVGDGPLRAGLEARIEAAGLQDRVCLCGALPETETLAEIGRADIFVLPSLMEGLPVVLMEAMAQGKPVIAPCVAGIPELVTHEESGLLFRPGDWDHLASSMWRLARDEALRSHIASRTRPRIEEEFSIEVAVKPLATLFRGLSRRSRNVDVCATEAMSHVAEPVGLGSLK